LEWLKSEVSVRGLEDTLAQFLERSKHDGLDQILCKAYDETMARIFEQNTRRVELARHVLSWISFAKRRLSIIEVQHAIAVKRGDKDFNSKGISDAGLIISVCCGLVTVDEESSVIRLVHYTTDEYFKSNEARLFPDVHGYLTRQCIFYLSLEGYEKGRPALENINARYREVDTRNPTCQLEEVESVDIFEQQVRIESAEYRLLGDWLREYPFCGYAADNWGLHARAVSQHARNEAIEMTLPFINNKQNFDNALQILFFGGRRYELLEINDKLDLAVYHGLDFLIEDLTRNWDAETCGPQGRKALVLACEVGHATIVKHLFLKLATMEVDIVDWLHNPLQSAAKRGHSDVIKVLLKLGMSTDTCEWDEETAIRQGIRRGHSDALVPLLDAIGSPEQQISYAKERGLMEDAIEERNTAFAQILFDRGLDVNDRVKNESPHLTVAIILDQLGMASWFLEKGAKLLRNDKGVTALMLASEAYGSDEGIDFLVGIGADLDEQDESGRTALMYAVDHMTKHHVVTLLNHGAGLSLQDQHGDTALHKACQFMEYGSYPRRDIVEVLLEAGADVNVKNSDGQTPGAVAIEQNQPTIARLMIESGGDVDWQDNEGQSLLMKTIEKHDHITSMMIIERSKDLDLQDKDGWTALDYAFETGNHVHMSEGEAVIWLLLERGAKANKFPEAMENTCGLEALFEDFRPED
jgi:ankyrin repeat protein